MACTPPGCRREQGEGSRTPGVAPPVNLQCPFGAMASGSSSLFRQPLRPIPECYKLYLPDPLFLVERANGGLPQRLAPLSIGQYDKFISTDKRRHYGIRSNRRPTPVAADAPPVRQGKALAQLSTLGSRRADRQSRDQRGGRARHLRPACT